jgi:hypothetical protein
MLGVLSLLVVAPPATPIGAVPISPFNPPVFTTNHNGSIFTIGNNLVTCPASAYRMVNLDADAVGTTFNSWGSDLL